MQVRHRRAGLHRGNRRFPHRRPCRLVERAEDIWLSATFVSFGLYAPRNATAIGVLGVAAISVAAAVFFIVELDGPFDGWIKVSGEPLRFALSNLGRQTGF